MAADDEDALYGRWVHSHEEDTADEMVFRPASHTFAPSRGRVAVELRADGTYAESAPGPVDVPVPTTGRWAYDGGRLVLAADGDRSGHEWEVLAADPDRLVVRK